MDAEPKHRWRDQLPALLILGSPVAAAGMAHAVALADFLLLTDLPLVTVAAAIILRLNFLLAAVGSAAGGLRVGGTVPTRIAVALASAVFAGAAYFASIALAAQLVPGYPDRYGP